ncbi:MAG TPA: hypothetical protein PLZ16_14935, partial [Gammaproteobacteria bacterium]|nr:hypothetical protein [Gammaproteobacteria bacterium]
MSNDSNPKKIPESGCVLLVDNDKDRIEYIENILQFIDYSIEICTDIDQLEAQLTALSDTECTSIAVGPG